VSHTVLRASSMQYQSRPPAVTSYCHCSIDFPLIARALRLPLSGCWRSLRCRGSPVMLSQAARAFAGAAEHTLSHPVIASLEAYLKSQPSLVGGGATRSRRLGNAVSSLDGQLIRRRRR
jgi:hypothetical protein